ncbi:MAG: hypothetical protein QM765_52635 [Myxococcales bacterium]
MFRKRLFVGLAFTIVQACGNPPAPEPDAGVHPLGFVSASMSPPNGPCLVPANAPECAPLALTVGKVSDSEVGETLAVRWYVDGSMQDQAMLPPQTPPSVERLGANFAFSPQEHARGGHVVKVVVSNGFATSGSLDQVAEGKQSAEWTWCVDTTSCANGKEANR